MGRKGGGHHPVFSPCGKIYFHPTPTSTYTFTNGCLGPFKQQALLRTQKPRVQLGLQPSCLPSQPMDWMGDAKMRDPPHIPLPSLPPLGLNWPLGIQARQTVPQLAGQSKANGKLCASLPLCLGHTALVLEACQAGLLSSTFCLWGNGCPRIEGGTWAR